MRSGGKISVWVFDGPQQRGNFLSRAAMPTE